MKPSRLIRRFAILLPLFCPVVFADLPPQSQITFTTGPSESWAADWSGAEGRTYFVQYSVDLVNWAYLPVIRFGEGLQDTDGIAENAPKFFIRLKYADETWVGTLQEARDADFDNDGIPNYYEVENVGSDPFDKNSAGGDSDTNGLPDGWEIFHFGGLGIADPNAALQPDGLTNKDKAELGLDPNTDYSDEDASQPASYTYDPVGRLTDVTAPVGAGDYTPDEEGNLLNAQ